MLRALRVGFPVAVVLGLLWLTASGDAVLMVAVSLGAITAAVFVFRDELSQMGLRWTVTAGIAAIFAAAIALALTAATAR